MSAQMIFITWDYNGEKGAVRAFERLGYKVRPVAIDQAGDISGDPAFRKRLSSAIDGSAHTGKPVQFVFSHDYFPAVSAVCDSYGLPYLSFVYDSPHYSLTSPTAENLVNRISLFDRGLMEELTAAGTHNLIHRVLSADPDMAAQTAVLQGLPYEHDVSFIGSLYRDRYTFFDQIQGLPPALKEYLDLAISAQQKLFGADLIGNPDIVPDRIIDALHSHVNFDLNGDYRMEPRMLLKDILRKKVTSVERSNILSMLGDRFSVDLYTTPGTEVPAGIRNMGYASYDSQMPRIFNRSKININITLRTIRTGIPQRALDIMACGGFLLSDYREELAEYFAEGEEMAMARTPEDFVSLTEYYLSHEDERKQIALRGQQKVLEHYTHDRVFAEMIGDL